MQSGNGRTFTVAALAAALMLANAHMSRAKADGGLTTLFGLALVGATVVVVGAIAGTVKLVQAVRKESAVPAPPSPPAPFASHPTPAAWPREPAAADESRRAFLARPYCASVGGYEAYLKQTGKLCRLH